jgi:ATP-binding cassette subfamily B protein
MAKNPYTDLTLYKRLLRQARPYWLHIVVVFLLSLLFAPIALLLPLPLKIAVDNVLGNQPLPGFLEMLLPSFVQSSKAAMLIFAAVFLVAIALLNQLQQLGTALLSTYAGEKMVVAFRTQLFHHANRLSFSYHDYHGNADSTYRILYDAPTIQYILIYSAIPFVTAGATLIGMIYITARINWQLSLIALAVSPMLLLILQASRLRLRKQWREVEARETSALSIMQETLAALRVVKAFGQESREEERFLRRSSEGMQARIRFALVEKSVNLLVGLATAAGMAVVLYIGVRQVQSGAVTIGDLLLVMGYMTQLYEPLRSVSGVTANLQSHLISAERALALLDEPPDVPERPDARPLRRAQGRVAFHNASFSYDGSRPVLGGVTFEADPGSRVGILGATGVGKTTIISLLTRFYDPTEGKILLDGVDLRDYKLADLRKQFAIVLQEPVLFSTSIAENISYARPGASQQDIVAAAKAANIHDAIARLSNRYETLVGERGMSLSGGERQRIAIARAFLKDAPILILDEPTSAVDIETEAGILEAMERLTKGHTTFIISHRLTTLRDCNLLYRLEGGRLIELKIGDLGIRASPTTYQVHRTK